MRQIHLPQAAFAIILQAASCTHFKGQIRSYRVSEECYWKHFKN
jgi:hypothetical protein